ncbi:hypothetical protein K505DRAFT_422993 [Melanomma pulvis-pyrius CBS 109.77]|uniref:Uncharacterized protein n=1 Tax=Melanomma pulvis-pyrius CBS 109.77 TaxID=1314802 RepID=A0A6A6WN31_9PLEO|nr:hypothetical protein K505DRAFT_422993 [Melanomma pulvis-pyrius CBS 109.77]
MATGVPPSLLKPRPQTPPPDHGNASRTSNPSAKTIPSPRTPPAPRKEIGIVPFSPRFKFVPGWTKEKDLPAMQQGRQSKRLNCNSIFAEICAGLEQEEEGFARHSKVPPFQETELQVTPRPSPHHSKASPDQETDLQVTFRARARRRPLAALLEARWNERGTARRLQIRGE